MAQEKGITGWMLSNKSLSSLRKSIHNILSKKKLVMVSYSDRTRENVISLINTIKKETDLLLFYNEAYQIYMAVEQTTKVKGEIAEVGSYRGGSAKIICEAKGDKVLHLFDTFEGLPELTNEDDKGMFHKGQFVASLDKVKDYLKGYKNVHFYKGLFPDTAGPIENKTFSFVHLDVDLYEATAKSLEFFYPRMNTGGVIMSHDYTNSVGVRTAFDQFFKDKPEIIIEMSGTQCLVVKH